MNEWRARGGRSRDWRGRSGALGGRCDFAVVRGMRDG